MKWFRLYAEFAHDPKVQRLSEADQRRVVMLFCMMCLGQLPATDEDVSFTLRISLKEWQKTKETLMQLCIINSDGVITNWDSRQYVSDSSTERVRKFRETLQKRSGNVTVTAMKRDETSSDTDTDTEQTQIQIQKQKQKQRQDILTPFDAALIAFEEMRKKIRKPLTDNAKKLILNELEKLAPGDEDTKIEILNQSIMNSWQGVFPLKQQSNKQKTFLERSRELMGE